MTSPAVLSNAIFQIIIHTPSWVWGLFVLLGWLGGRQMRASTLSLRRVVALPLVMTALSLLGTVSAFGGQWVVLLVWAVGAGACAATVLAIPLPDTTRFDAANSTFHVPGSAMPLMLMLGIFAIKYALAVATTVHPLLAQSAAFALPCASLLGAFSGAFAARALRLLRLRRALLNQSPVQHAGHAITP